MLPYCLVVIYSLGRHTNDRMNVVPILHYTWHDWSSVLSFQVEFSPVDKCVATCSGDRTVKLWSVTDYSCLKTFQVRMCGNQWCALLGRRCSQHDPYGVDGISITITTRSGTFPGS